MSQNPRGQLISIIATSGRKGCAFTRKTCGACQPGGGVSHLPQRRPSLASALRVAYIPPLA